MPDDFRDYRELLALYRTIATARAVGLAQQTALPEAGDTRAARDTGPAQPGPVEVRCRCFFRDLTPDMIERYVLEGTTVWAIYQRCAVHDYQAMSPVWSPEVDLSRNDDADTEEVPALAEGLSR